MEEECEKVINLTLDIYKDFGFENVKIKFSDRPKKRIGDDDTWDFLEKSLLSSLKNLKLEFSISKGEGAFYGPKIEFVLVDAIGREWQCGTLQVDLNLPPRLGANFIDKDGSKKHPVMLHRAFFGSLERFIGILIENYAGRLPNWLAPVQVAIATVNDNCVEYSKTIANHLSKDGVKFKFDFRNEKLNYKIRDLSLEKVPHIAVIGEKEIADKTISLRSFPENKLASMQLKEFLKKIKNSCSIE
jgi:threonyl-tRNA synthetase